jgi:stage IV sporulation protein FB
MRDVLSWSFPIGQLFGIMIRVHFVLPIVMVGLIGRAWVGKDYPVGAWQDASMLMALMFVSILLHEFGHCFAARYMDGEADEVLLWPLGGLAFCRSLPHTPSAHFVTALGGPLVNVALCIITGLVLMLAFEYIPPFNPFWDPYRYKDAILDIHLTRWDGKDFTDSVPVIILARAFWINWILLLFNIVLVGHPFDSGRMLQAALWPRLGHYTSSKYAIYAGFVVAVIVGLYSIVYSEPLMAYLTIFIFIACAQEWVTLESAHEDSLFGYDFSQGYTSLEKDDAQPAPPKPQKQNFIQRWLARRAARKQQEEAEQREAEDRRMDELLEKIQKFGKESLTDEEHRFLKRVSDRYKNRP